MASQHHGAEYVPLMTDDAPDDCNLKPANIKEVEESAFATNSPDDDGSGSLKLFVTLACLVSLLSLAISSFSAVAQWRMPLKVTKAESLRHPSLYIGLDAVFEIKQHQQALSALAGAHHTASTTSAPQPTHTPGQAIGPTVPFKSFRISSTHPEVIYPVDAWVLLTETDTMLMEFYLPVSGFTQCAFGGFFPKRSALEDKLLTLEGDTSAIDIWDVSLSKSFNASLVTWHRKPARRRHLGTVSAAFGANSTTKPFPCVQGFPFMVELTCTGPGCRVEFKVEEGLPRLGSSHLSYFRALPLRPKV